jgi:hypothetical protein
VAGLALPDIDRNSGQRRGPANRSGRLSGQGAAGRINRSWHVNQSIRLEPPTRIVLAIAGVAVLATLAAHAAPSCSAQPSAVPLHSTRTRAFVQPDGRSVTLNGVNVVAVWGPGGGAVMGPVGLSGDRPARLRQRAARPSLG